MLNISNIDLADEQTFQRLVVEIARIHGWRVAHFPASLSVRGRHMTATAYDARGYPDLTLVHPKRGVMFRELKRDSGKLSEHQIAWLQALNAAGVNAGVWKPSDWPRILTELGASERSASAPTNPATRIIPDRPHHLRSIESSDDQTT